MIFGSLHAISDKTIPCCFDHFLGHEFEELFVRGKISTAIDAI